MQPETRESYGAAAERLRAHAEGAEPAALVRTGDEVLAVAALLGREPRLRRALSDPARPADDRAELLRQLLSDKVGDEARDLVAALVGGRWSSASALLDATERLGVDALLIAADRAGELAEVEDELFRFGQVVVGSPQLGAVLGDSSAPVARRTELAHGLLDGKAREVTVRLVEVAVARFGGRGFAGSLHRLVELAAQRRERQVAYVTVAAPLSEEEEQRLGAALSEIYGREVSMKPTVDPEVLGGLSVQVGSDLYDGTVLRRLTDVRNALTKR